MPTKIPMTHHCIRQRIRIRTANSQWRKDSSCHARSKSLWGVYVDKPGSRNVFCIMHCSYIIFTATTQCWIKSLPWTDERSTNTHTHADKWHVYSRPRLPTEMRGRFSSSKLQRKELRHRKSPSPAIKQRKDANSFNINFFLPLWEISFQV